MMSVRPACAARHRRGVRGEVLTAVDPPRTTRRLCPRRGMRRSAPHTSACRRSHTARRPDPNRASDWILRPLGHSPRPPGLGSRPSAGSAGLDELVRSNGCAACTTTDPSTCTVVSTRLASATTALSADRSSHPAGVTTVLGLPGDVPGPVPEIIRCAVAGESLPHSRAGAARVPSEGCSGDRSRREIVGDTNSLAGHRYVVRDRPGAAAHRSTTPTTVDADHTHASIDVQVPDEGAMSGPQAAASRRERAPREDPPSR